MPSLCKRIGLLVCVFFLAVPVAADSRPNIVFFVLDDMHRWMFNCLPEGEGRNLTPNIDRLAREGVLMMGLHVSAPVCTPSRYNVLTGRYASRALKAVPGKQVAVRWNSYIAPGEVALPKLLQEAGYTTALVGKNHVILTPSFASVPLESDPNDPDIRAHLRALQPRYEAAIRAAHFDHAAGIYPNNPDECSPRALRVHNLDYITKGALDFIEEQSPNKPFFLCFASTIPHWPYVPERSWDADPRATPFGLLDEPLNVLPPRNTLPDRIEKANLKRSENQENMLWLDDAVGAVLNSLETQGLLDNTIIFFFNDHGQSAKGTLYQGGLSDPAIIWRMGGFPCDEVNHTLVSNVDFAPTILDLVGTPSPKELFDGRSFKKTLFGSDEPVHESLYAELGYTRAVRKGNWKYLALRYPPEVENMSLEVRKRNLKFMNARLENLQLEPLTTDPTAGFSHISPIPGGSLAESISTGQRPSYYDADQLYDLSADPAEDHNLADDPEFAAKLAEMKAELQKYLAVVPGTFAELKPE